MITSHMLAVSMAPVAYMIAIKRTAGLFAALYGVLFLGERKPLARVTGAGIMSLGAALVGLMG